MTLVENSIPISKVQSPEKSNQQHTSRNQRLTLVSFFNNYRSALQKTIKKCPCLFKVISIRTNQL